MFLLRRFRALSLTLLMLPLTGCLVRTRNILITTPPNIVISASPSSIVDQLNKRYDALQSLTATVSMTASVENSAAGQAKDYTKIRGYIVIRKPEMLHVRGLLPIVSTPAFDMVSDGTKFKMYIPPLNKAITGGMTVSTPSKNTFENLRPPMFLDSMIPQGVSKDELVSVTSDTRILDKTTEKKQHHVVEEPDYDVTVYRAKPNSNQLTPLRVIHISRTNMQPFQLDVYDESGAIETQAIYDNYSKFGNLTFPAKITIKRPQQQLTLVIDVTKLEANQQVPDDQFTLDIPENTPTQNLP